MVLRCLRRLADKAGLLLVIASSAIAVFLLDAGKATPGREVPSLLALAWFAAAQLMAVPYCRRFAGGRRERLKIGALLGLLFCAPLAPFLWRLTRWEVVAFHWTLGGVALVALSVAATFDSQGRYGGARRELPELTGESRSVAEDVIRRAGLIVASIRVGPFASFNAGVQGLEKCVVVVDRRAAETLPPGELASLIAHESGHVRYGGIFPYLAVLPTLLLGTNVLVVLGWLREWNVPVLGAVFLLLRTALSHWLELRCDEFAARLTGPEAVKRLLERIHRDPPAAFSRLVNRAWLAPFFSHPALGVRTAVLDGIRGGAVTVHCVAWTLAFSLVLAVPAVAFVAEKALGRDLGRVGEVLTEWPCYAYGLAWLGLTCAAASLLLKRQRRQLLRARRRRKFAVWFAVVTASSWIITLCLMATIRSPVPILLSFLVSLLLLVAGLLLRAFRYGHTVRLGRGRKRAIEVYAAILEGKTEEGLALAEATLKKHPRDVYVALQKASCLLCLGRTDEAEASLTAPLAGDDTRPSAELVLASVEYLRGNLERMLDLAKRVCAEAPSNVTAWSLRGNAARKLGRLDEAADACDRACELSENEASALALRALTAIEKNAPPGEIDAWLAEARARDARKPIVLFACARWSQTKGQLETARDELRAALEELRRKGMPGWVPAYEREARSWGLIAAEPGGVTDPGPATEPSMPGAGTLPRGPHGRS